MSQTVSLPSIPQSLCPLYSQQIVFEGIRGPSFEGDIAIDDVSITMGKCKQENTVASAGKTGKIDKITQGKHKNANVINCHHLLTQIVCECSYIFLKAKVLIAFCIKLKCEQSNRSGI